MEKVEYSFKPIFLDPDILHQQELRFSVKSLPSWLSLNHTTGEIKGTNRSTYWNL